MMVHIILSKDDLYQTQTRNTPAYNLCTYTIVATFVGILSASFYEIKQVILFCSLSKISSDNDFGVFVCNKYFEVLKVLKSLKVFEIVSEWSF